MKEQSKTFEFTNSSYNIPRNKIVRFKLNNVFFNLASFNCAKSAITICMTKTKFWLGLFENEEPVFVCDFSVQDFNKACNKITMSGNPPLNDVFFIDSVSLNDFFFIDSEKEKKKDKVLRLEIATDYHLESYDYINLDELLNSFKNFLNKE